VAQMKKNEIRTEIRTDEEAPLTTPVDASVLEYYRPSPEEQLQVAKNLLSKRQKSFFRKREKAKIFFFCLRNLYSSCSRIYSSIVKT
jgi:hypothetical protein